MKNAKDGKFIKTWGQKGSGRGEFEHAARLGHGLEGLPLRRRSWPQAASYIFDQNGTFLEEWKQFGRPSGVYIDRNDVLYVADDQSDEKVNPGFERGIRIGSIKSMER